ncbi:Alpha-glucosidase [Balamuthia mandrillaris]
MKKSNNNATLSQAEELNLPPDLVFLSLLKDGSDAAAFSAASPTSTTNEQTWLSMKQSWNGTTLPFNFGSLARFEEEAKADDDSTGSLVRLHCGENEAVQLLVKPLSPQVWCMEALADRSALISIKRKQKDEEAEEEEEETRLLPSREEHVARIERALQQRQRKSWVVEEEAVKQLFRCDDHKLCVESSSKADSSLDIHLAPKEQQQEQPKSSSASLRLRVQREPLRFAFFRSSCATQTDGEAIPLLMEDEEEGMSFDEEGRAKMLWRFPKGGILYGLGERSVLRKEGRVWEMWNEDASSYTHDSDTLYQCLPLCFVFDPSRNTYCALFFDNPSHAYWDLSTENRITICSEFGLLPLRYYIITGDNPSQVIQNYTLLSGRIPLPPKWVLGFQQSRWSYDPAERVQQLVDEFRKRDIPCDLISIDIDYMDGYRCFTWDKRWFPNPKELSDYLHERGMKIAVVVDPGIKKDNNYWVYQQMVEGKHFVALPAGDGMFEGIVWPGPCGFPDFTHEEARSWWGTLYKDFVHKDNIDGFWNDMNEPAMFLVNRKTMDPEARHAIGPHLYAHNVYGMLMARASYEGLRKLQPDKRPFLISRSGFCGAQRYAWTWTGDNTSTWRDLKMCIPVMLGMAICGISGIGFDIGGFDLDCTPELFARWIELGCLVPLCRNHANKPSIDQEPWAFGPQVEEITRLHLKLRYRFLPYLYTWLRQYCVEGTPLVRPLWLEFPQDRNSWEKQWEDSQFMVGPHVLVAPVMEENATERMVYLPSSTDGRVWFDFYSKTMYKGGQVISVSAPLDFLPLFVLSGTVLPLRKQSGGFVEETEQKEMEYVAYGREGEKCEGLLYQDDGTSHAYLDKEEDYGLFVLDELGPSRKLGGNRSYQPKG